MIGQKVSNIVVMVGLAMALTVMTTMTIGSGVTTVGAQELMRDDPTYIFPPSLSCQVAGAELICSRDNPEFASIRCLWETVSPDSWRNRCHQTSWPQVGGAYVCDVHRLYRPAGGLAWSCTDSQRFWYWEG